MISSVSAGVLLLLVAFITISIQMPTVNNYMYFLHLRKMGYVKLINEEEFKYDAYVVYCESDKNWTVRTLVAKLESKGLRLCFPYREFEVGTDKCDQIVSGLIYRKVKRFLLSCLTILRKKEWCFWQFNWWKRESDRVAILPLCFCCT